jgi:hypothetical protein
MVRVHIIAARQTEPVVVVEADEHECRVAGPGAHLVDPAEAILGLPSGRRLTAEEAPEEWARGLIVRFRSPDLVASIVHDDDPLPIDHQPVIADAHALR